MKQDKANQNLQRQPLFTKNFLQWSLMATFFVAMACKKDIQSDAVTPDDTALNMAAKAAKAPVVTVRAGSSIQNAINAAAAGTTIKIQPGVYYESIVVDKPNITLDGEGNVTIENPGGAADIGIKVSDGGDGFTLKNVTLKNFKERGVNITYVDGFLLSHVTSIHSGEFGLFAEYCQNGTIEHCETSDHRETGVFVGQSTNVTVTQNKSYANVIGLEVENSAHVTFDKNHTYDNAVGIMCLLVPGRIMKQSSNIIVTNNQVRENNHVNFSAPPEMESVLPSGVGILLVGIDDALVSDNHVTDNKFTGIALVSTLIIGSLANLPPAAFGDIEPNPDRAKIIANKVQNNGFNPPSGFPLPGVDLLWDGSGNDNCWKNNVFSTSFPSPLPACQ